MMSQELIISTHDFLYTYIHFRMKALNPHTKHETKPLTTPSTQIDALVLKNMRELFKILQEEYPISSSHIHITNDPKDIKEMEKFIRKHMRMN